MSLNKNRLPETAIKTIALFIVCLMPSPSASEKLSSKIHIPVEKYTLKNGLRVLLNPDSKVNTASYILGVAVGSRHEKPGITGISHMFEHLMFRGTKKYPSFDRAYGDNGVIGHNAWTSKDWTAYHAGFPPDKLELILDVESDRMSRLTLSQEILDKEKKTVQEERLLRVDNSPFGFLLENLFDLLFTKHPYRQPIIGYKEDISAYTLESLRSWYETYYSPNNAVLVISGKFPPAKAKKYIERYFGPLPSKDIPKEIKSPEPERTKARSRVAVKDVQSPHAVMAYIGPPFASKEAYALEIISHILGAGESSWLYKKIAREDKLLPSISFRLWSFLDYSVALVSYPLPDLSKEKEIKKAVLEEIKQGLLRGINRRSLEKSKNMQMKNMVFSLKRSASRARLLADYEIQLNDYKKLYDKFDLLDNISPEFIQKTGEKYLAPDKLSYVILKPGKAK